MGGLPDDPIQSLRPASVGPPDARICSVDAPTRWLDAPIPPDCCHCSSPTRSEYDGKNGRSTVPQNCFSMGSGPNRRLTGPSPTGQLHRAADRTGFATPTAGLAHPCFRGRHAQPRCPGLLQRYLVGHHRVPSSPFPPTWGPVPDSENRQCHAGAENQTVFEGS
jgi:hypothetical protein